MNNGKVVAGAGLWLFFEQPRPFNLSGKKGYVLNVLTEPEYRRRGLARYMMQCIIEWCREQDIKMVNLHASDKGLPLYKSLGFSSTGELGLRLD
jgi:GNAT superfamily N-acetyltransferase